MGLQTPRGPLRVLIAEDEAAVRELLAESIRGEPEFELVGAASDATEAIMFAAAEQPDVVLLDVRMPGGGGLRAAKGIRRRSPGSKMIALSGNGDRGTVLEMLQVGVVGYLVKGGPIDEIVEAIKGAPEGHGSLSTNVASDVISELTGRLNVQARIESRRSASERRIRRALEDESALAMVFQPIVALHGRKIVGVEALARFAGPPKRGSDVWFAEAAAVGLGVDLELAAVRKAIEALPHFSPSLYLSVNVSPATLMKDGFYKLVSKVECERLVAEVTEHARIDDYERLAAKVGALRALGMRLAVDDAGAGFSSLRHILNLSPDLIKLDLTLTRDINLDRSKQALAAGLITFAEKTGAAILAEGIETAAELEALVGLGVGYGQGWFLGKPAPIPLPGRSKHRPSSELIEACERWSL